MLIAWSPVIWSGLVAATFAAALFWLFRAFAATRFTAATALAGLVFREPDAPLPETFGQLTFLLLHATVVALVNAELLLWAGGATLPRGVLIGGLQGLIGILLVPLLGTISASVRNGPVPSPGRFGTGWGPATPVSILVGYVVYGAVFATAFAGFATIGAV